MAERPSGEIPQPLRVEFTLWNKWVRVRKERTADGTTIVYFGFGRLAWRK